MFDSTQRVGLPLKIGARTPSEQDHTLSQTAAEDTQILSTS